MGIKHYKYSQEELAAFLTQEMTSNEGLIKDKVRFGFISWRKKIEAKTKKRHIYYFSAYNLLGGCIIIKSFFGSTPKKRNLKPKPGAL